MLGVIIWFGPTAQAELNRKPREEILWEENCKNINPDDWSVVNGKFAKTEELVFVSNLPEGGKSGGFARNFRWDARYPYLQVKVKNIEFTTGYKSWYINVDKMRVFYLGGAELPGIFTMNLLDYENSPVNLKAKSGSFKLGFSQYAGIYTYEYIRMLSKPENAVIMRLIDKEKEGEEGYKKINRGDKLAFEVYLKKPAVDVTVTIMNSYCLGQIKLNGEEYIQLVRADDKGKVWKAEVKITEKATPIKRMVGGILVKATILGGDIEETYTTNAWPFDTTPRNK